jgi:transketolase
VYQNRPLSAAYDAWNVLFESYCAAYPELGAEFKRRMNGDLFSGWHESLPRFPVDKVISI